jgi:hypothetical protein
LEARFSAPVQTGPGTHPASCTMGPGSFPGVKWPRRGLNYPPQSSALRLKKSRAILPLGLCVFKAGCSVKFTFIFYLLNIVFLHNEMKMYGLFLLICISSSCDLANYSHTETDKIVNRKGTKDMIGFFLATVYLRLYHKAFRNYPLQTRSTNFVACLITATVLSCVISSHFSSNETYLYFL